MGYDLLKKYCPYSKTMHAQTNTLQYIHLGGNWAYDSRLGFDAMGPALSIACSLLFKSVGSSARNCNANSATNLFALSEKDIDFMLDSTAPVVT